MVNPLLTTLDGISMGSNMVFESVVTKTEKVVHIACKACAAHKLSKDRITY